MPFAIRISRRHGPWTGCGVQVDESGSCWRHLLRGGSCVEL